MRVLFGVRQSSKNTGLAAGVFEFAFSDPVLISLQVLYWQLPSV